MLGFCSVVVGRVMHHVLPQFIFKDICPAGKITTLVTNVNRKEVGSIVVWTLLTPKMAQLIKHGASILRLFS